MQRGWRGPAHGRGQGRRRAEGGGWNIQLDISYERIKLSYKRPVAVVGEQLSSPSEDHHVQYSTSCRQQNGSQKLYYLGFSSDLSDPLCYDVKDGSRMCMAGV